MNKHFLAKLGTQWTLYSTFFGFYEAILPLYIPFGTLLWSRSYFYARHQDRVKFALLLFELFLILKYHNIKDIWDWALRLLHYYSKYFFFCIIEDWRLTLRWWMLNEENLSWLIKCFSIKGKLTLQLTPYLCSS